jgi:hypothetical protein
MLIVLFAPACGEEQDQRTRPKTIVEEFEPSRAKQTPPPSGPAMSGSAKPFPPATPEKARIILLEDKRCKDPECQTTRVIEKLGTILSGLEVVRHDWSEEECKALFDSEGLTHLPAFLFEPSIEMNPGYRRIARYLAATPKGRLKQLQTGASFDPRAEICDNGQDDTGNGLIDCRDPSCTGKVLCRQEIPERLDLFVMSMCPFGTMAMDSMSEVLDAFDRRIDFRIHYIADETDRGFRSLHGQPEVDEDIRELCAIKHFPKEYQYMEYIWCRNRQIKDKNWKACTGNKGIDAGVLQGCFAGEEGKALLSSDLKLAKQLGVGASPTWLANNRFLFHGIAPETVKQNFCRHNPTLKGCERKLSTTTPKPEGACK